MIAGLRDVDRAVLAVDEVDIKVLELFFLVLLLSHEVEGIVLVVQVGRILSEHGDAAHVNRQAEEATLEEEVHVAVHACVRTPIVHLQFLHQWQEH